MSREHTFFRNALLSGISPEKAKDMWEQSQTASPPSRDEILARMMARKIGGSNGGKPGRPD